jgi:hypothetical protein
MSENEQIDDAAYAAGMIGRLPSAAVPPALEARILADFDRVMAGRSHGLAWRLAARWRDLLWPGAPVWQPAGLLAASLAIGLLAGALVPASSLSVSSSGTVDQVLSAMDTTSPLELYKDL